MTPRSGLPATDRLGDAPEASGDGVVAPRIGQYAVLRRLGEGGMGVVYAGYDERLDRRVALKVIKAGAGEAHRARMIREGQALARLAHPNVVPVFEVGDHDGELFLAMEFVQGQTLREWQQAEARTWEQTLGVFLQAARGLAAAHEAGLLHRDFKPDNAIIGGDGRVRVLDFGLARALEGTPMAEAATTAPEGDSFRDTLTATGAAVGTPAYMAAEQFLAEEVDARTDVFAWCVSLFEALYGKRPYRGKTRAELALAVTEGDHLEPTGSVRVPAFVERVVLRGIQPDKSLRPQSMDAVLEALDVDPGRRRERVGWVLGAAGATAAAAAIGVLSTDSEPPCQGFEARLIGVWDDDVRGAVKTAFEASGAPLHAAAWAAIEPALDERSDALVGQMQAACEATQVTGAQSDALLDRRMACLDARVSALRGLTAVLTEADRMAVANAPAAVEALPDGELCANVDFLEQGVAPPSDAEQVEAVARLRKRFDEHRAMLSTGHPLEANAAVEGARAEVEAIGYAPLAAEMYLLAGRVTRATGGYAEARNLLLRAADVAEGARHDLVLATAWIELVYLGLEGLRDSEKTRDWIRRADASLQRLGRPKRLSSRLAIRTIDAAIDRGDFDEARTILAAMDDDGESDAYLHRDTSRGRLALAEGDGKAAIEAFQDALSTVEAARGLDLNNRARAEHMLATAYFAGGQVDEARAHATKAVEAWREGVGEAHPELGRTRTILGALALSQGDIDEAAVQYAAALESIVASVGPTHPSAAEPLIGLGVVAFMRSDLEGSERHTREALTLLDGAYDEDRAETGAAAANLGETLLYLGRLDAAKEQLARGSAVMERTLGPRHPDRALPLKLIGIVHLLEGEPAAAVTPLREALALTPPTRPYERSDTLAALAVALLPSDAAAARAVAGQDGARLGDPTGLARRQALIDLLPDHQRPFETLELIPDKEQTNATQ